ncbi:MAG: hypothetical protein CVT94_07315 [Bacteroidetes bacterium HGW-Bacteroidetes-11]|jgi:uncharacterized protein|nr:MAG: hypothetical protein CVT94_07315 [Bacteroidetes bacterium HGW-Bacteroidetes-11]
MKNVAAPIAPGGRLILLDILRGFAIFGILMVNMKLFFSPIAGMLLKPDADLPLLVLLPDLLIRFLFEGKFYTLFSLLFGYGFWIFMNKQIESGSILPIYRRRLFVLLVFGILHILLLWAGDILFFYALFGFILILFRKSSNRKITIWAIVLILIPPIVVTFSWGMLVLGASVPEGKAAIDASMAESFRTIQELIERANHIYSNGSFYEIINIRLAEWRMLLPALLFFYPTVLGVFLLGMVAARKGFAEPTAGSLSFYKRVWIWSLLVGVICESFFTYASLYADMMAPNGFSALASLAHAIGAPALTLFYISSVITLYKKGFLCGLWNALVPVGRMALTNYLMQSVICTTIFYSYGFGYFGKFTTLDGVILVLVIFVFQIFFSRYWLSRFRFGPMEWLWRRLTYLSPQPMRKR